MRKLCIAGLFLAGGIVSAQTRTLTPTDYDRLLARAIYEKSITEPLSSDSTEKLQEQAAMREFYEKAQEFVTLWRSFALDLNSKRTFNAKLARKVSKAFHDLENSDGWPVGRDKR